MAAAPGGRKKTTKLVGPTPDPNPPLWYFGGTVARAFSGATGERATVARVSEVCNSPEQELPALCQVRPPETCRVCLRVVPRSDAGRWLVKCSQQKLECDALTARSEMLDALDQVAGQGVCAEKSPPKHKYLRCSQGLWDSAFFLLQCLGAVGVGRSRQVSVGPGRCR